MIERAWDRAKELWGTHLPRIIAGAVFLVLALYHVGSVLGMVVPSDARPTPIVHGVSALILVWSVYSVATNRGFIWNAINGVDGRPSTSVFQGFIWSAAVIYAYVAVATKSGKLAVILPPDLLLAMGLTVATFGAAKLISARNDAPTSPGHARTQSPGGWRYLYLDDQDRVNFGKLQLLSWTLVAVGLFLVTVTSALADAPGTANIITTSDGAPTLPDLGVGLVLLQGLGTATYLGDKLVPAAMASIADVKPRVIEPGAARLVTVTGTGFGENQEATFILLDGELQVASAWADTKVEFTVADAKRNGEAYPTDRALELRVGGASPWTITIATDPVITGLVPPAGISLANQVPCTINGTDFGDQRGTLLIGTTQVTADAWGQTTIVFTLPAAQGDNTPWAPGSFDITIERPDKRRLVKPGGLTLVA